MKRIKTMLLLALLPLTAGAQGDIALSYSKALWHDSGNASGLYITPIQGVNFAALSYNYTGGGYHLQQEGGRIGTLSFDTQGAVDVKKFKLWGQFRYDNRTDWGSRYNTNVYDPFDDRNLYSIADTTLSDWKRQNYFLAFKATLPIVEGRLFAGLYVSYADRIASKQMDPRAESFGREVDVKPSVSFKTGSSVLGLNFHYANTLERSTTVLSNTQVAQNVFVLRGLGNYNNDMVGSGGLDPFFYSTNLFGGAFQYGLSDILMVEAGADWSDTQLRQSATQPRPMDGTAILKAYLDGALLIKGENLQKISLKGSYSTVTGTEYATKSTTDGWEIATRTDMVSYNTICADAGYSLYLLEGGTLPYKWEFDARAGFASRSESFLTPESTLDWASANLSLRAVRQFAFRGSQRLKAGAQLSGTKGLGGEYLYKGQRSQSRTVTEWYPSDLNYRIADSFGAGLDADFSLPLKGKTQFHICASGAFVRSSLNNWRTALNCRIYLVF